MGDIRPDEPVATDPQTPLRVALVATLRRARARLGWSVERLADECEPPLDRKTVSRVLHGRRANVSTLERIMLALGIRDQVVESLYASDTDPDTDASHAPSHVQ